MKFVYRICRPWTKKYVTVENVYSAHIKFWEIDVNVWYGLKKRRSLNLRIIIKTLLLSERKVMFLKNDLIRVQAN